MENENPNPHQEHKQTPPAPPAQPTQSEAPQAPHPPAHPPTGHQPPHHGQTPPPEHKPPHKKIDFSFDARTKLTVQWSAIWFAVGEAIGLLGDRLSTNFIFGGHFGYGAQYYVTEMFWALVSGAITGFILSKFYKEIMDINKKYFKGKLDTLFKLLFYPSLVASIVVFFLGSALTLGIFSGPFAISLGLALLGDFVYAKMLSEKIESQYEKQAPPA